MKKLLTCIMLAFALIGFSAFSQNANPPAGDDNAIDLTYNGHLSNTGKSVVKDLNADAFSRNSIFCDGFNIENTTTIPGWTEQSGDWQIFNNMLKTPGNIIWEYITVDGSAQTDGCITGRAIYDSPSQTKFLGLVGRYNSSENYILFKIQDNGGGGYWNSWWLYVNESILVAYVTDQNYGTDAIIQMEYTGIDVTVRIDTDRDGTWDYTHSTTVSNTSSGLCGVAGYASAFMDDYCCGAECVGYPGPVPTPISNIALFFALFLMLSFSAVMVYRRL